MEADRPDAVRGWEFAKFVSDLVLAEEGGLEESTVGGGVDLVVHGPGAPTFVETKVPTPQNASRLRSVASQLREAQRSYLERHPTGLAPKLVLAIPGVLSPPLSEIANSLGLEIWDGQLLRARAAAHNKPIPQFLVDRASPRAMRETGPGDELLKRLARIPPGKAGWVDHENLVEDVLNFLFSPPLSGAIRQSENLSRVKRRDYVMANIAESGFWSFMRTTYRADFVIIEAKNLVTKVKKDAVLQLANYLSHHGAGLFGLLVTRNGLARDADLTCREQWILHDKLILGLTDRDLIQMITSRVAGDDPGELLRQTIQSFRLGL